MKLAADIALGLLVANGLRVTIGLPPIRDWFRKTESCPACEGTGWIHPAPSPAAPRATFEPVTRAELERAYEDSVMASLSRGATPPPALKSERKP